MKIKLTEEDKAQIRKFVDIVREAMEECGMPAPISKEENCSIVRAELELEAENRMEMYAEYITAEDVEAPADDSGIKRFFAWAVRETEKEAPNETDYSSDTGVFTSDTEHGCSGSAGTE